MRFLNIQLLAVCQALFQVSNAATNNTINSQLRLAYAGSTGMFVSWNTFEKLEKPTVHYGLSPWSLNKTASSDVSVTYPTSLTYNNHVKITGLEPDTTYYYLPEHLLHMETILPYAFKTSRPAGDQSSFAIAYIADMGTMGPQGLTTTAGSGVSSNNTLKPGEINTVQSLDAFGPSYEFLWHCT